MVAMYPLPYPYDEPDLEQPEKPTLEEEVSAIKSKLWQINSKLEGGRFFEQHEISEQNQKIDDLLKQTKNMNEKLDCHINAERLHKIIWSVNSIMFVLLIVSLQFKSCSCNCPS